MNFSPQTVSNLLINAYPECNYFTRQLIRWRPYICPFHKIIEYVPPNKSILDVGCGIGLTTVLLSHTGKTKWAIGIDISQRAIEIARTAIIPDDAVISFQCIAKDEPWPNAGFDAVTCIDVFHHIPSPNQRRFIENFAQVGDRVTVIFKDISPSPRWKALTNMAHDLLTCRQWTSLRDEEEVKKWFREDGFTVLRQVRMDMLWYSHYLLVAKKS